MSISATRLTLSLLTAASFMVPHLATAHDAAPKTAAAAFQVKGTQVHNFSSVSGDETYRLLVSLPDDYDASGKTEYPVFYVLDGHQYFATAVNSYRVQRLGNDVEPLIIVGIAYDTEDTKPWLARRASEWTPTQDSEFDKGYKEQQGTDVTSGGAARFRQVLSSEILPFVSAKYSTNGIEGLFGHSLGGLFATYDLLQEAPSFEKYSISSPSLWWDESVIFKQEEKLAAKGDDLTAKLFLSVGALEGPQMVPPMEKMGGALETRGYKSLDMTSHVFEDETHLSVQPATLSRALRVLFAPEDKAE